MYWYMRLVILSKRLDTARYAVSGDAKSFDSSVTMVSITVRTKNPNAKNTRNIERSADNCLFLIVRNSNEYTGCNKYAKKALSKIIVRNSCLLYTSDAADEE